MIKIKVYFYRVLFFTILLISVEREVMSMIHAICDFCGKDCDRTATLLSMTPFQNFARYHTDNEPYGNREKLEVL